MPASGVFNSLSTAGLISCAAAPCAPMNENAIAAANNAKDVRFMFSLPGAVSDLMEAGRGLYLVGFTQFPSRQMNPFGSKLL
jgi:hypothetical protein